MMLTDLADVLRAAGLNVVEQGGWKVRSNDGNRFGPVQGILCHWTGTALSAQGDYPTLNIVTNGRSDLPGMLAQLGLGRNGTWYVIGAGVAWHAGAVDQAYSDNYHAIGIEAEYHPAQGAWPEAQQRSYERGCKALAVHYGVPLERIRGHYEAAIPYGRKPDPNTLPGGMPGFRQRVAAVNLEEDDMTPEEVFNAVWNRPIAVMHGDGSTHTANTGDVLRYSELQHQINRDLIKQLQVKVDALAGALGDDEAKILAAIRAIPGGTGGGLTAEQAEAAIRKVFADAGDATGDGPAS